VSYVDAGYAICLGVLALYALGLVLRHRRLERAAALLDAPERDRPPAGTAGEPAPAATPRPAGTPSTSASTTVPHTVTHPVGNGER
jgi:hypothetical protein